MSGICGIVHESGRAAEHREIGAMLKQLEQRGPDGSNVTLVGHVGLGHASLATTPEAFTETLPLTHAETGCIITADVRLDYPEQLEKRLGVTGKGDGELILLAYLKWGHACLDHLRGDFAFAIHDPRDNTLFCARDQIGMRQLIWHHQPGRLFGFATEAQTLLEHPDVPCEINEARIGDFLEDLEAYDLHSTFFLGLHKLPPAHAMTLRDGELHQWRYWQAQPQEPLELPNDQSYADAFREVFTQAVRTRLRSHGSVGSMLSGGMDSGSVVAVAAQLVEQSGQPALKTFSALRNTPDCVESNTIRAAMKIEHLTPAKIALEDVQTALEDLTRLTRESGEPFDIHMTLPRVVYLAAHHAGVNAMLDGVGGDTTLGSEPMVDWYFRQGKVLSALREARGEKRFWGRDADSWTDHARSFVRAIAPAGWLEGRQSRYRERKLAEAGHASLLSPDFATRINMADRRREHAAFVAPPTDIRERAIQRVFHPHVVVARERYDRTAAALAIEPRDPFLDLRVIEFCLALPQSQLQHNGWPKIILRRAMKGLLPEEVRWRRGKEHLGFYFTKSVLARTLEDGLVGHEAYLQQFVKSKFNSEEPGAVRSDHDLEALSELVYFAKWAKKTRG